MSGIPLPRALIGDIVVGDLHPVHGTAMFEVDSAYRDDNFHWVYVNFDKDKEMNEVFVDHVYKMKNVKRR